jgi:hypothetical protein
VSNEVPNKVGNAIRKVVYRSIHSVRHFFVNDAGDPIGITWNMPRVKSSAYYYANSIYNDITTADHTKTLLSKIVNYIKRHPDTAQIRALEGYTDEWGIVYLITRPLEYLGGPVAAGELC